MMTLQTWGMLELKGTKLNESCKSARELFAYGGTEPLPTLGTPSADVILTGNNSDCRATFVVVKPRKLLTFACIQNTHWVTREGGQEARPACGARHYRWSIPDGPSGWISPLVVVPKNDADARAYVDTCRAKAIIHERHPIPTECKQVSIVADMSIF